LLAPITFVGFTALSVETRMNFAVPFSEANRATISVPMELLRKASAG
jgi:hypothetical protein